MISKLFRYLKWYWCNRTAISKLKEQRDFRIRLQFNHMYCELHGSLDCDHSTWSSRSFKKECTRIRQWYNNEVAKLK